MSGDSRAHSRMEGKQKMLAHLNTFSLRASKDLRTIVIPAGSS